MMTMMIKRVEKVCVPLEELRLWLMRSRGEYLLCRLGGV